MAIGMTPLIPLDRVIADPAARFERFGINNNQLFGKPMVTFGGLTTLPMATRTVTATPKAEAAPTPPGPGAPSSPGALVDVLA